MRIAILVPGGVDPSGTEKVIPALLSLMERLARRHRVRVIAGHPGRPRRYALLGAEVIELGDPPGGPTGVRFARRLKRVLSVLREEPPDLLHAFWAGPIGALAGAAGRIMRAPVVLSIAGGELVWLPEIEYGGGTWKSRALARLSLRLAGAVTAGSRYALARLPSDRRGRWIPLGADASRFSAPLDRPPGPPFRLLQVASVNRVKDPGTMLGALARVRAAGLDVTLDWVGEDILAGEAQRLAARLGLTAEVRFAGFRTQAQLVPFFRAAHLYVQSSRHEAQGVAILEAAASGLPLVGTGVGLLAEMAPDAAVAAPVGDEAALARAIQRLLEAPGERLELAAAAQRFARAHDADWTAAQFEALYRELVPR